MRSYRRFRFACVIVVFMPFTAFGNSNSRVDLDFDSVDEAVRYAQKRLAEDRSVCNDDRGWSFPDCGENRRANSTSEEFAAVVIKYSYDDGSDEPAHLICPSRSRNGNTRFWPNKARVLFVTTHEYTMAFRLTHRRYHEIVDRVKISGGEVTVVDDLVLEHATKESGCEVTGRVWLEGNEGREDVELTLASSKVSTGPKGEFRFEGIAKGNHYLSALKKRYHFDSEKLKLERGERVTVALKGYYHRAARVRWAYQPDGSRDLSEGLESGETILSEDWRKCYRFSDGFQNQSRQRDFAIRQVEDRLQVDDVGSYQNPGVIRLSGIELDEVLQAPDVIYERGPLPMREGDVFIFKTRDGGKYAKLQVMEIIVSEDAKIKAMVEMARQPLDEDE
ncbi:MAG TPA: hypothetical protein PKN33_16635 [Phycisphaerae bacterium]|nr:hypothetical protein [Phycisphaerae bacterium]